MCGCVRAQSVLRTQLSNPREVCSEEGKVLLRSQEVRPKEWEASEPPKRVNGAAGSATDEVGEGKWNARYSLAGGRCSFG